MGCQPPIPGLITLTGNVLARHICFLQDGGHFKTLAIDPGIRNSFAVALLNLALMLTGVLPIQPTTVVLSKSERLLKTTH